MKRKTRDPMARVLRTPAFRKRVISFKNKKLDRKRKHKGNRNDRD